MPLKTQFLPRVSATLCVDTWLSTEEGGQVRTVALLPNLTNSQQATRESVHEIAPWWPLGSQRTSVLEFLLRTEQQKQWDKPEKNDSGP
jgi:hypothetical protein